MRCGQLRPRTDSVRARGSRPAQRRAGPAARRRRRRVPPGRAARCATRWADGFANYAEHNVLATQRLLEAVRVLPGATRPRSCTRRARRCTATRRATRRSRPTCPHPFAVRRHEARRRASVRAVCGELRHLDRVAALLHGVRAATATGHVDPPALQRRARRWDVPALRRRYADPRVHRGVRHRGRRTSPPPTHDVAPGIYCNLAGGGEITLNELIALVGELAGAPVAIDDQPAQPGDSFRNGGAIDRARELLGWEPVVSLRDGIARQLAWHRSLDE